MLSGIKKSVALAKLFPTALSSFKTKRRYTFSQIHVPTLFYFETNRHFPRPSVHIIPISCTVVKLKHMDVPLQR